MAMLRQLWRGQLERDGLAVRLGNDAASWTEQVEKTIVADAKIGTAIAAIRSRFIPREYSCT